jgi:hypothetical protein
MEALDDGVLDDLAASQSRLIDHALRWIAANPQARQPWDQPGHRPPDAARYTGPMPDGTAPRLALDAIADVLAASFDAGAEIESRLFAALATSDETQALIGLRFLDRTALRRAPADPGWMADFTARLAGAASPEAMVDLTREELAAGRIPSAAAANIASVQAGFPATLGGVLRHLARQPLPPDLQRRLQAAIAADAGTNKETSA